MTTAGELWLDSELGRVLRGRVQRDTAPYRELSSAERSALNRELSSAELSARTGVPLANIGARLVSPAVPNVASSVNANSSTYTYGPYNGPALSDEDVRRLEHPEEFR